MQEHIKITNTPPRVQYVGDGTQREFFFPFAIFKPEHVEVFVGNVRLTDGMTVEGAGESAGGAVILDEAPDMGILVTVRRHIAIERTTDFQPGGAFSARLINDELDYLTAALQQVAADAEASLHLDATEPSVDMSFPPRRRAPGGCSGSTIEPAARGKQRRDRRHHPSRRRARARQRRSSPVSHQLSRQGVAFRAFARRPA